MSHLEQQGARDGPADGETPAVPLPAADCELVIFDLDGVLTRTASVHAAAWKALFDGFLARRSQDGGFRPFDVDADYRAHVDGKPRLDGVRDFLAARGIGLPEGTPEDPPGDATLWALGNAKNARFEQALAEQGVETYAPALALLDRLEACGIARAVVSASRSCRRILEVAGIATRFQTVVDGTDAAREGLPGKPAPDTFLAAAARLQVPPARAVVIEDAEAGVAAGRAGGFGLVVGVDRGGHAAALDAHGADRVVQRLDALRPAPLPRALEHLDDIRARLGGPPAALFLDYDGTLTPIVSRPEDAVLDDAMRRSLAAAAGAGRVVVVTGRGLETIRELVGLDGVVYATDHGFRIDTGEGEPVSPGTVAGFDAVAERVAGRLRERVAGIDGALVEAKQLSVAVHYRLVAAAEVPAVQAAVREELAAEPRLRLLAGKRVLELQPDVEWDKGAAVTWVLEHLGLEPGRCVYVGDDVTDEAAFRRLRGRAVTVAVRERPRPTAAGFTVAGVGEVRELVESLGGAGPASGAP